MAAGNGERVWVTVGDGDGWPAVAGWRAVAAGCGVSVASDAVCVAVASSASCGAARTTTAWGFACAVSGGAGWSHGPRTGGRGVSMGPRGRGGPADVVGDPGPCCGESKRVCGGSYGPEGGENAGGEGLAVAECLAGGGRLARFVVSGRDGATLPGV